MHVSSTGNAVWGSPWYYVLYPTFQASLKRESQHLQGSENLRRKAIFDAGLAST